MAQRTIIGLVLYAAAVQGFAVPGAALRLSSVHSTSPVAASPSRQLSVRIVGPQMGMFGLGTPELAVIGVVVMFVLGPDQMKSMAKEVAKVGVQLKQVPEEFNKGIEDGKQLAASELADEDKKAKELLARERAKDPLA